MSNELRMPFAEWLYRMKQSDLPPQAMMLAVGAVFFKVTSNEQLARMVNMDTRGIADKTYNKWKYQLSRDGWVIIRQITVGRRTTIEVHPAYKESPVKFTSFRAIDPATLLDATSVKTTDETEIEPVTITSADRKSYGTRPVETTGEERNNYEPVVETTAEAKEKSPHTPLKENKQIQSLTSSVDRARDDDDVLGKMNGTAYDLEAFISRHAMVDAKTAKTMLANNIKFFTTDTMLEAYNVTVAHIATSVVAKPYVYLIETARKIKNKSNDKRGGTGGQPRKSMGDLVREEMARTEREKPQ